MPTSETQEIGAIRPESGGKIALLFSLAIALSLLVDENVYQTLRGWPAMELAVFDRITRIGQSDWILLIAALLLLTGGVMSVMRASYWRRATIAASLSLGELLLVSIAAPGLFVQVIKRIIGRARPETLDQVNAFFFAPLNHDWQFHSFPSGHTTTSFALALVLSRLTGPRWAILWFGSAGLIALSRATTGAHFVSDIVAGAGLGTYGAHLVMKWLYVRRRMLQTRSGQLSSRSVRLLRRSIRSAMKRVRG